MQCSMLMKCKQYANMQQSVYSPPFGINKAKKFDYAQNIAYK